MSELNGKFIKNEQDLDLDTDLDLQNCIEEFDRVIYQIPEEFTLNSDDHLEFCDNSNQQNDDFKFDIVGDGDHG